MNDWIRFSILATRFETTFPEMRHYEGRYHPVEGDLDARTSIWI